MRQCWLWRVKTVLLSRSTKTKNKKIKRMTHQNENSQNNTAVQHILDNGLDGIGEAIRLVIDQAMKIERSHALQAQPHERTEKRQGYANGFKGKTVSTRVGDIRFSVPQVRGEVELLSQRAGKGPQKRTRPQAGHCRDVCPGRLHPQSRRRARTTLRP